MNSSLIAVLAVVALVILVLILKKFSAKKVPPADAPEEEISAPPVEDSAEVDKEEITEEDELEPVAEIEEPTVEEGIGEAAETAEAEIIIEPEAVPESEIAEEAEPEPAIESEPEVVSEPVEEPASETVSEIEEPTTVVEAGEEEVVPREQQVAAISLESYEQRLFALKDQRLTELTAAIENNEESRREQLQIELVALTEALSFLQQGYEQEISCRNRALAAMELMRPELDTVDYERACRSMRESDTEEAEQVFDGVADRNISMSAPAAYQSGCLAECRMDLNRAMDRLDKAITLDGNSPDFLRSAALLARKLYLQKKALAWFTSLVKLLEEKREDTVELALARRELAYTSALVGRHKQAGALYKKAMVSLTNLMGKEDPEMGICWYQIGKLQEALGQYEKAEDPYRKALAIMGKAQGNVVLGDTLNKLAGLYMELERESEAVPLFERLCAFKEESSNPDNASLAMAYNNLAEAYRVCGKYEESEKNYKQSLAITEELRGKDHAAVGSILQELAQLCQRQGKKDEAKEHQERATAIFQRVLKEQEAGGKQSANLTLSD